MDFCILNDQYNWEVVMLDVAIIGCGVVGAAAAYELSHYPLHVAVLEAENIRLLTAEETLAMEPQLAPTVAGALFAPSAAIVSPWEFALAMAEVAVRNGVELYRSTPVTNIEKIDGGWQLTTPNGSFAARYVVGTERPGHP